MTAVIDSFIGKYDFLSNFYHEPFPFPVFGEGVIAQTAEHAFQAMKTKAAEQQEWVLKAKTPGQAKYRGRRVTLRNTWDHGLRVYAMRTVIEHKFVLGTPLADRLIATKHAHLTEGNRHHDNYWGVCSCTSCDNNRIGGPAAKNMLGELLMAHRTHLRVQRREV